MKKMFVMLSVLAVAFSACNDKKPETPTPAETGESESTKKSLHAMMQQVYLWNQFVPATFDYSKYTSLDAELDALVYKPKDKWSFIMDTVTYINMFVKGESAGYGMSFANSNNTIYISRVDNNSPAKAAGIKRGAILTAINGKSLNTLTEAEVNNIFQSKSGITSNFSISYKGTSKTYNLTTAIFTASTVYKDTVITTKNNAIKVGYMAYSSFIEPSKAEFDVVFGKFATAQIKDLIIDVRDNGGGSVEVANYLMGYVVPSSASGKTSLMFKYNSMMSKHDTTFTFVKHGSLNLSRVFILANSGSASASEILINSLKPYMTVQQIGTATHGKPVGMNGFGLSKYVVFPITFSGYNADNEGDYYNGLTPNFNSIDDYANEFGNPQERYLATALYYIDNNNSYPTLATVAMKSGTEPIINESFLNAALPKPIAFIAPRK